MKKLTRTFTLIFFVAVAATLSTCSQESKEDNKISSIVDSYEQALNGNNVEGLMQLFTEDGIVMVQNTPTNVGVEAVRKFYESLFKTIDIDIKFKIAEVVQISPEWAFVRSTSSGTVTIISHNSNNLSEGQELFILKKQSNGDWKIARYAASSTK